MRGCLQLLAVGGAVVFMLVTAVAATILPLVDIVTDRAQMTAAFAGLDDVLMELLPGLVADRLEAEAAASGFPNVQIDERMLQEALNNLLPPGWVDAQVATAVNAIYDALDSGNVEAAEFVIDTQPVLQQARGPAGQQLVSVIVAGVPECTQPLDPSDYFGGTVSIPPCVPAEIPQQLIVEQVHAQFITTLSENPALLAQVAEFRVPVLGGIQSNNPESEQARRQFARLSRLIMMIDQWRWLLWWFSLFCLLIIAALVVRSVASWGTWWGWPLLLTGVLLLLLSWLLPVVIGGVVETAVYATSNTPIAPSVHNLMQSVLSSISQLWRSRVLTEAALLAGGGVILIALGALATARTTP